ncbi:MAG: transposase [Ignavibacteria bacterium]|nr:transposase [Ignavibacteria bacterium]
MLNDSLHITRRHLPHWSMRGATYFVTFRTKSGSLTTDEQMLALEHIKTGHRQYYGLIAAIVMPDHAHLLFTEKEPYGLSRIMKGIKGVSAWKINKSRNQPGHVWQDESYDRIVRDQAELIREFYYMLYNPVKQGLTNDPWRYHGWRCNLDELPHC